MLGDSVYSSVAERTRLLGEKKRRAEAETGEKKMFVTNITDEADRLMELHDIAYKNGINGMMLNGWALGLSVCRMVRRKAKVPLLCHFDFMASFTRLPYFGLSVPLVTKLQRITGFDIILFPGFGPRMKTRPEEVLANLRACLQPMGPIKPALPVPGGSDWAGNLPNLHALFETNDFGVVPGRGVFNHPSGPCGGAKSYRQVWAAMQQGTSLEEAAKENLELRQAIETFG